MGSTGPWREGGCFAEPCTRLRTKKYTQRKYDRYIVYARMDHITLDYTYGTRCMPGIDARYIDYIVC